MSVRAYIGLGSNLAEPVQQIRRALTALSTLPCSQLMAQSPLYQSPALIVPGSPPQPDFVNAVAALDTELAATELLAALHAIEAAQGRIRSQRWAARTLDLDLLLYGETVLQTASLTLPHPALSERAFVVLPLLDIAPGLALPDGRLLAELLPKIADQNVQVLRA